MGIAERLLSFVVCGAGPTGIEFAAELIELLNEDLLHALPKIRRDEISFRILQSQGQMLNTCDDALSKYTEVSCCTYS